MKIKKDKNTDIKLMANHILSTGYSAVHSGGDVRGALVYNCSSCFAFAFKTSEIIHKEGCVVGIAEYWNSNED